MPHNVQHTINMSVSGMPAIAGTVALTADGLVAPDVTLPAGTAGTLTTRTDDNTGVATLEAGHGLQTNDVCDIYWVGGKRTGMTATVATNAITLDGGAGDNLPVQDTVVVVTKQVVIEAAFDGDDVVAISAISDQRTAIDFQDSGPASLFDVELVANEPWGWASGMGTACPITGNAVAQIVASNGTTTAARLRVIAAHDSTP